MALGLNIIKCAIISPGHLQPGDFFVYDTIQPMKRSMPFVALFLLTAACRPVLTIGWSEIAILVVLILILLGPVLFRIYRWWFKFKTWKNSE